MLTIFAIKLDVIVPCNLMPKRVEINILILLFLFSYFLILLFSLILLFLVLLFSYWLLTVICMIGSSFLILY